MVRAGLEEGRWQSGGTLSQRDQGGTMINHYFVNSRWSNHTSRWGAGKLAFLPLRFSPTLYKRIGNMINQQRILRWPSVQSITGMARSTLYKAMKDGEFPRPISIGSRSVGWLESDVRAWLDRRIALSRTGDVIQLNGSTP